MSDIGGGVIKDFSFSKAWGTNPSAATGTVLVNVVGRSGSFTLGVGDYVVFSFGSVASFPGIVSEVGESQSFGQGRQQTFQVVDNRVRLGWQMVFGAWNIEDDVSGNQSARPSSSSTGSDTNGLGTSNQVGFGTIGSPTAPVGVGALSAPATPWAQRRRYRHLLPEHWQSGIWTYTESPFTTKQILNSAFNHVWGDYGFTRNYHSALDDSVMTGMDYSGGIKLGNLVSEINSKVGLDITISGARTLIWGRKGDGLPPVPDRFCTPSSNGLSLTSADSGVRVVGDPVCMQRLNVTLEPDWQEGWNVFIDELAWMREVASLFAMPTATKSDLLDVAAFARQVTVYQYAKKKGDLTLLDVRPFGRVSRCQLPAWVYIRELVYRSYRIPPAFTLHGVPLSSLELNDTLLCNTDVVGEGVNAKQCFADSPIQFYPAVQVTAITRGQPLDLINERDIRLFYRNSTKDLRNEWTVAPDFEVDAIGKSIRFSVPTFIDGDADEDKSIYLRINTGEGGGEDLTSLVGAESDYLDIVVPNPGFEITPAEVRASFCFRLGRFFKDYGVGPRRGSIPASGLGLHVLDMTSDSGFTSSALKSLDADEIRLPDVAGSFKEVVYDDGGDAISKADQIASSAMALSHVQNTGGFTRNGLVGTPLTPVVDRITVNINTATGVTEQVEYSKARTTSAALAERTLQRIQRSEELFAGQDQLKREIREYQMLAAAERPRRMGGRSRGHQSVSDVFARPVGCENPSTVTVTDTNSAAPTRADGSKLWKAGDLVWLNGKGVPVESDGVFGGVLTVAPKVVSGVQAEKELPLAYSGRVPVRVEPGIPVNATVYGTQGDPVGRVSGDVVIGRLAHGEETPAATGGELLAMVDLGGGGGAPDDTPPLTIVASKPAYIPSPGSAVAENSKRYYITWGTLNNLVSGNWDGHHDVSSTTYFFAKATLRQTGNLQVTEFEIVTGAEQDSHVTPDWALGDPRPEYMVILLGSVLVYQAEPEEGAEEGAEPPPKQYYIVNSGGGSIVVSEHVTNISGLGGLTKITKELAHYRQPY